MSSQTPAYLSTIGFVAGVLTTFSFAPQLVKTLRTRQTRDISGWWLACFIAGLTLWLSYGLLLPSRPIVAANLATLLLTLPILALKIYHREQR